MAPGTWKVVRPDGTTHEFQLAESHDQALVVLKPDGDILALPADSLAALQLEHGLAPMSREEWEAEVGPLLAPDAEG